MAVAYIDCVYVLFISLASALFAEGMCVYVCMYVCMCVYV